MTLAGVWIKCLVGADNVQFIGDIIPPLKIVGELAGKVAGFGAAGVVGFGIQKVADGFRDAAKEAYNLDTHAQNTAMSVRDFTQLAGAMRILGADSESAASSIEGIFKAFNEAASGNAGVMSLWRKLARRSKRTVTAQLIPSKHWSRLQNFPDPAA
jgi:hypothetical protein